MKDMVTKSQGRQVTVYGREGLQLSFLRSQIEMKDQLIDKLKLDVGDMQARMLAQGIRICELERKLHGVEEGEEYSDRRSVADIVAEVLENFPGVTWKDIISVRRERRLTMPRHECMYAVYTQRQDLSFPTIGRMFGNRDHTTVLHAVKKVRAYKEAVNG